MGIGETAALVAIIVAVMQGLMGLIKHLVTKNSEKEEDDAHSRLLKELAFVKEKVIRIEYKFDIQGATQEKIVERLENISQAELKILVIIERLERRMESLPG